MPNTKNRRPPGPAPTRARYSHQLIDRPGGVDVSAYSPLHNPPRTFAGGTGTAGRIRWPSGAAAERKARLQQLGILLGDCQGPKIRLDCFPKIGRVACWKPGAPSSPSPPKGVLGHLRTRLPTVYAQASPRRETRTNRIPSSRWLHRKTYGHSRDDGAQGVAHRKSSKRRPELGDHKGIIARRPAQDITSMTE